MSRGRAAAPSAGARLTGRHVTRLRLRHQHLTTAPLADPVAVVRHQGAVQAQDYAGAKWALALRLPPTTDARLDAAFDAGEILRTHVLRPTWHFVAAADIRWLLALTAPRVHALNRGLHRRLELDGATIDRAMTALHRALEEAGPLDRDELRAALERAGIAATESLRFAYIMMFAELEALVCSGPRRGKQHTYALLDTRAPAGVPFTGDDALRELTRRYFDARGPATLHDFTVWSGLTLADGRRGLAANGDAFASAEHAGQRWWLPAPDAEDSGAAVPPLPRRDARAHLLPNYDEYFIGFTHRAPLGERVAAAGGAPGTRDLLAHLIAVDGQIVGGWRRTLGAKEVRVELAPLVPLSRAERGAVETAAARYGRFLERAVVVDWMR